MSGPVSPGTPSGELPELPMVEELRERLHAGGAAPAPFDGRDPVVLLELTREQIGWRAAMHLLAVHGGHLLVPAPVAPALMDLATAAGWMYLANLQPDEQPGMMRLSCIFTPWARPEHAAVQPPGQP